MTQPAKISSPNRYISTSRPRFWIYVFWPFIVGLVVWIPYFDRWRIAENIRLSLILLLMMYFSYPANLLIYWVNDIFDYETDKLNQKKTGYEWLIVPSSQRDLWLMILVTNIPFLTLLFFADFQTSIWIVLFAFASVFYSAPPIRAKAKPFFDTIFSAFVYVSPWFVGYFLVWWSSFDFRVFAAAILWNMAMHAYSAIPDIQADREANIQTIATLYEKEWTLIFCILCFLIAMMWSIAYLHWLAVVLWIIYVWMMLYSYKKHVFKLYQYFPWINALAGMAIFWYVVLMKLG